jgi:hypothetical protein
MAPADSQTTTKVPRIDLLIVGDKQFLTSPARPGYRYPVKPDDRSDDSGLIWSMRQFGKELAANVG